MARHNPPVDLLAEIAEMKARIRRLETNNRVNAAAVRGGTLLFQQEDGRTRLALGNVALDGTIGANIGGYGVFEFDDEGAIMHFTVKNFRGQAYPAQPFPFRRIESVTVTSSTFTGLWVARINFPVGEVLAVHMVVQADVGTTGEVRLTSVLGGGSTDPVTIGSGANGLAAFSWIHPAPCGLFDKRTRAASNLEVSIEARRTSGTGNVTIFQPETAEVTSFWLENSANSAGFPRML